ncbi:25477_t:CDS:2, partial [Racocetra persica]
DVGYRYLAAVQPSLEPKFSTIYSATDENNDILYINKTQIGNGTIRP